MCTFYYFNYFSPSRGHKYNIIIWWLLIFTDIIVGAFTCWTVASTVVQQSLARLLDSCWYDSSTVTGTIVQQSLVRLFNSRLNDYSTVTGTIVQQSLARFSTVAGTIIQQLLAWLFNSHWHDCSTATCIILQQWLARVFNSHGQDFFFFLYWQNSSTVVFTVKESCHVPENVYANEFNEQKCFCSGFQLNTIHLPPTNSYS